MADSTSGNLRLPEQDLTSYPHFELQGAAAAAWAEALPLGNAHRACMTLRTVLSDLNRVALAPATRFALLEELRPALCQATAGLTQTLLGESALITEEAEANSELIADLCELGAAGYALAAVDTIRKPDAVPDTNPARLACEALQRAVALRSEELLQAYLVYRPVPLNHWAMLHRLYALAERQQLANLPVMDPVRGEEATITGEYLPGLLIACCRTNQLRQKEILSCFELLRHWQNLARLEDPALGAGLFVVDLAGDRPPDFSDLLPEAPGGTQRYLNTRTLVERLNALRQRDSGGGLMLDGDLYLDSHLPDHIARALGERSQRHFTRQPARPRRWIATGLSSVHYFVAGERRLDQVLYGDEHVTPLEERNAGNPFLADAADARRDRWQQANPEEDVDDAAVQESGLEVPYAAQEESTRSPQRHTVFTVESANVSPGGYCVEWSGLPDGINIGDVVCLQEREQPRGGWSIAVIRWISQVKHAPTLLGLELLSPGATAYAGQVRMPDGGYSQPIRVLLLPEIPLVGQPHTLLAPRLVFKENQKIILSRKGETFLVKLKRQLAATAAFGQFDFEYRRQLDDDVEQSRDALHASRFESVWSDI